MLVLVLSPVLGLMIGVAPIVAALPFAGMAIALAMVSARARLVVAVFGALFVFRSSDAVTVPKLAYFSTLLVLTFLAAVGLYRERVSLTQAQKWVLTAVGVWLAIVLASSVNALANGATPTTWLRTALPYLLMGLLVLLGLDAGRHVPPSFVALLAVTAGFASAVGEMAFWASRRQLWSVDIEYLGLSSPSLVALGVGVAFSLAVKRPDRRVPMLVVGAAMVGMSISPGTRTSMFLLVGLVGLMGPAGRGLLPPQRGIPVAMVALGLTLAGAFTLSSRTVDNEAYSLSERLRSFTSIAEQGVEGDASASARALAVDVTWSEFVDAPVFGRGPGAPIYGWINDVSYRLDTPLTLLAHLGIVGLGGIAFLAWSVGRVMRVRVYGPNDIFALAARIAIFALAVPFLIGGVYHEKGLSIALALVVAGRFAELRTATRTGDAATPSIDAPEPATDRPRSRAGGGTSRGRTRAAPGHQ